MIPEGIRKPAFFPSLTGLYIFRAFLKMYYQAIFIRPAGHVLRLSSGIPVSTVSLLKDLQGQASCHHLPVRGRSPYIAYWLDPFGILPPDICKKRRAKCPAGKG